MQDVQKRISGKEVFESNYRFDSTFNTVYWIGVANGVYTENQRTFAISGYHDEPIQDRSGDLRLIYSYNFAFRSIGPPNNGFGMYIIVAGNRSFIDIQGLVKLTPERNFTNILTEEELLRKIKKSKLKKDVRKSISANIGKEPIGHKIDHPQGQTFGRIFYLIRVRDVEHPGDYMFDPWTGELNRIVYTGKPK